MAVQSSLLLVVLVNLLALGIASSVSPSFNYTSFPPGFVFGAASAAYQYEGAVKEGGRGPSYEGAVKEGGRGLSVWDTFTHKYPGRHTTDEKDRIGWFQILHLLVKSVT
ncbi:unnamed protein product [Ilex paraguariensis]|uniref:Uncharacterized protein n=1 Tax=Ilex paraguariensis TaxID=185542 RepID=A0ABC8R6H5_9AQUA